MSYDLKFVEMKYMKNLKNMKTRRVRKYEKYEITHGPYSNVFKIVEMNMKFLLFICCTFPSFLWLYLS